MRLPAVQPTVVVMVVVLVVVLLLLDVVGEELPVLRNDHGKDTITGGGWRLRFLAAPQCAMRSAVYAAAAAGATRWSGWNVYCRRRQ